MDGCDLVTALPSCLRSRHNTSASADLVPLPRALCSPILSVDWAKQEGDKRTGAIGWGGGAQTNFWADPDNDFVVSTPLRHAHPRLAPTGGVW
jgi:CubicO group peptidase (beta-lactamase class C family)